MKLTDAWQKKDLPLQSPTPWNNIKREVGLLNLTALSFVDFLGFFGFAFCLLFPDSWDAYFMLQDCEQS